jgi:hypothetical protein
VLPGPPAVQEVPGRAQRLEKAGLAERRDDGRYRLDADLTKRELKAARVR